MTESKQRGGTAEQDEEDEGEPVGERSGGEGEDSRAGLEAPKGTERPGDESEQVGDTQAAHGAHETGGAAEGEGLTFCMGALPEAGRAVWMRRQSGGVAKQNGSDGGGLGAGSAVEAVGFIEGGERAGAQRAQERVLMRAGSHGSS